MDEIQPIPIPTAKDSRVIFDSSRKSISLIFDTPGQPTAVEVPLQGLPVVLSQIAHSLEAAPDKDARALAQTFAIRDLAFELHSQVPTVRYEMEMGMHFQSSIEHEDARRLLGELQQIVAYLDSHPAPKKQ